MGEKVVKSQAALQTALRAIDLRIHLNDGFSEWRAGFDPLGLLASFFEAQRLVFDDGIEFFQISASDRMPELFPGSRLDADGLGIGPDFLRLGLLLPESGDEEKGSSMSNWRRASPSPMGVPCLAAFGLTGMLPCWVFAVAGMSHFCV
ncbi:MAG: hypothetical protein IPK32_06530 [Verrucomicrobiaceae bacterium]|nr:hypothetical protein [Verrucomicrobiaceae bacterium]